MSKPTEHGNTGEKRALVVDDVDNLGQVMCSALEALGYAVDRAHDGREALHLGLENHYDLVVCDLLMPRMNGLALYEAWVAEQPELAARVVFVTGDNITHDIAQFLIDSGRPCMYKPFRLGQLTELIAEIEGAQAPAP